jgi:UDP-2,4-diacetamido-2,4,6-trideoxy-beta-L-altropyranose hydrolase
MKNKVHLRFAEKEDCKNIYGWRNNTRMREIAFNSDEIPFEEHEKWFYEAIKNPNRNIFIIMDENFNDIGTIRFDKKGKHALVNIIIGWDFVGKGYGSLGIMRGSIDYLNNFEVGYIIAEIKKDNLASIKAFEKAGYKLYKEHEDKFEYRMCREKISE